LWAGMLVGKFEQHQAALDGKTGPGEARSPSLGRGKNSFCWFSNKHHSSLDFRPRGAVRLVSPSTGCDRNPGAVFSRPSARPSPLVGSAKDVEAVTAE